MEKKRKTTVAFLAMLLVTTLLASFMPKVTTITVTSIDPPDGPAYYVSADPIRIPGQGLNTSITLGIQEGLANATYAFTINVTDPAHNSYTKILLITTNASGSGKNITKYYGDFPGAHTNLTGTYLMAVNETLATGNFTVGLTDKPEYGPTDTVHIRGSGYLQPNERVWVNITLGTDTVFWQNKTAVNGVVETNWIIPTDAEPGTYTVTLTNATTPGTIKAPPDIQNFTVFVVKIDSIGPDRGPVGTEVRVLGEIIKSNGSYQILWDGKNVTLARPALGRTVNDTFIVPPSIRGIHNVTLHDITYPTVDSAPVTFSVNETTYYVFAKPDWVQEGLDTNITVGLHGGEANKTYAFTVNVTDPKAGFYNTSVSFITDKTGSGNGTKSYLEDFDGANTDFVGTYNIDVNKTLAKGNFTVGLTDKPKYRRDEIVSIRGSAYQPYENMTINIEFGGESVAGYPKINVTANGEGVVNDIWFIPISAEPGTYTVTITNATIPGTVKEPADIQNFTVTGVICQIQIRNLDNETVANLRVLVYNITRPELAITFDITNETGWVRFSLEAGNYTFWALWREEVMVGSFTNRSITEDCVLTLSCKLAHIKIAVKDEATPPNPLPFINVILAYNYTTYYNVSRSKTEFFETNASGIAIVSNTLTNISYAIEARRFDHLFNRTLIENLTASLWVNITCPTYTLFVNVLDADGIPLQNVYVSVYEWSTWIPVKAPKTTNQSGSTDFFITFGRYKVSVSNYSAQFKRTVVINETIIDLVQEKQWMLFYCRLFNLDLSVKVVDYFGQSIPNALVEIEREGAKMEDDLQTKSNGIAWLNDTIGGKYQISVHIRGRLLGTKLLYLDESKEIVFKVDGYVVIGGYPLETSQLITLIAMSLLAVILGFILAYRRLPLIIGRKKPSEKVG